MCMIADSQFPVSHQACLMMMEIQIVDLYSQHLYPYCTQTFLPWDEVCHTLLFKTVKSSDFHWDNSPLLWWVVIDMRPKTNSQTTRGRMEHRNNRPTPITLPVTVPRCYFRPPQRNTVSAAMLLSVCLCVSLFGNSLGKEREQMLHLISIPPKMLVGC